MARFHVAEFPLNDDIGCVEVEVEEKAAFVSAPPVVPITLFVPVPPPWAVFPWPAPMGKRPWRLGIPKFPAVQSLPAESPLDAEEL